MQPSITDLNRSGFGRLLLAFATATVSSLSLQAQGHSHGPAKPPATARPTTPQTSSVRPSPSAAAVGDSVGVAQTIRTLFSAAERNDLAALDTMYAGERLTIVEGAGINRGWADYRDHHLAPEMKEMKNFRYRPIEIEAGSSGDLGWSVFSYALQGDIEGKSLDLVGRGTALLERRGNRWIVRHTQTSYRARRPTDPPMPQ